MLDPFESLDAPRNAQAVDRWRQPVGNQTRGAACAQSVDQTTLQQLPWRFIPQLVMVGLDAAFGPLCIENRLIVIDTISNQRVNNDRNAEMFFVFDGYTFHRFEPVVTDIRHRCACTCNEQQGERHSQYGAQTHQSSSTITLSALGVNSNRFGLLRTSRVNSLRLRLEDSRLCVMASIRRASDAVI